MLACSKSTEPCSTRIDSQEIADGRVASEPLCVPEPLALEQRRGARVVDRRDLRRQAQGQPARPRLRRPGGRAEAGRAVARRGSGAGPSAGSGRGLRLGCAGRRPGRAGLDGAAVACRRSSSPRPRRSPAPAPAAAPAAGHAAAPPRRTGRGPAPAPPSSSAPTRCSRSAATATRPASGWAPAAPTATCTRSTAATRAPAPLVAKSLRRKDEAGRALRAGPALHAQEVLCNEAEMQELVPDHPNIVAGAGAVRGADGHVTEALSERAAGGDATGAADTLQRMWQENQISHAEYHGKRCSTMRGTAKGLAHLEQNDVSHNDIKGDNVLLGGNEAALTPKIGDFGLAGQGANRQPFNRGTRAYCAPERLARGDVTRSDAYAFGQMAHALSTGTTTQGGPVKDMPKYRDPGLRAHQAMHPAAPVAAPGPGPAAAPPAPGPAAAARAPGPAGPKPLSTAFSRFVERTTEADPDRRATVTEAQGLDYLAKPMIEDDEAQGVLARMQAYRRPGGSVAAAQEPPDRRPRATAAAGRHDPARHPEHWEWRRAVTDELKATPRGRKPVGGE
ncbi:MAG: protein kinase [Myxococcota bacterium]